MVHMRRWRCPHAHRDPFSLHLQIGHTSTHSQLWILQTTHPHWFLQINLHRVNRLQTRHHIVQELLILTSGYLLLLNSPFELVDLRILFAVILKSLTVGIILTHNHPSGTLKPSSPDVEITKKIQKAAGFFDIKVLDHIILAPDGRYYSFADDGLL